MSEVSFVTNTQEVVFSDGLTVEVGFNAATVVEVVFAGRGPKGEPGDAGGGVQDIVLKWGMSRKNNVITAGVRKAYMVVPVDGTITKHEFFSDVNCSAVLDLWKENYAGFPPTVADTITASAKPTLSGAKKVTDATLAGWTLAVSAGDKILPNVDSNDLAKLLGIELYITPTA